MRRMILAACGVALTLLVGCGDLLDDGRTPIDGLEFEILEAGGYGAINLSEPEIRLIEDQAALDAFWVELHSNQSPLPSAPTVDFIDAVVLAALDQQHPSGGYGIGFRQVVEAGDVLELHLRLSEPGEMCITTQALTNPYQVIRVPTIPASTTWVGTELDVHDCT